MESCEAIAKFHALQIDENRVDLEKNHDKQRRHNLMISGIPEENNKIARDCVKDLFTEVGLTFGVGHTDRQRRFEKLTRLKYTNEYLL